MGASCGVAAAPAPDIEVPSHPQPAASATAAPVHRERNLDLADETKKITASEQQVVPPATRDSAGTDVAAEKGWYMKVIVESHQGTEKKERRRSRVLTDPTIYRNIQVPFSPLPLLQSRDTAGCCHDRTLTPKVCTTNCVSKRWRMRPTQLKRPSCLAALRTRVDNERAL